MYVQSHLSRARLILALASICFLGASHPALAQTVQTFNPNGSVTFTAQGGAGVSITVGGGGSGGGSPSTYSGTTYPNWQQLPPMFPAISPPTYTVPPFQSLGGPVIPPMNTVIPPMNPVYPPMGPAIPPLNPVYPPMNPVIPPLNPVYPPMNPVIPSGGPVFPPLNPVIPSGGPVYPPLNPVIPSGGPVIPPGLYLLETPRIVMTSE